MRGMAHFCSPLLLGYSSFFFFSNLTVFLNWRIIALQCWGDLCRTSVSMSNYIDPPALLSLPLSRQPAPLITERQAGPPSDAAASASSLFHT